MSKDILKKKVPEEQKEVYDTGGPRRTSAVPLQEYEVEDATRALEPTCNTRL